MVSALGTIAGQIKIDVTQALASYAAVRAANAATTEALAASSATFLKVGGAAVLGGAAIGALFATAINSAAQFEKKIDFFGAVTNATQADMQAVADKAISMSKTTIYSADQMADAFVEFGKAGISTQDILNGVADATAALAQAADISISEASNTIVAVMSTFHIAAADTMGISDRLAGAANASIVDVSDLATSLKYVGGIAEATGVSFNSTLDALALLGNAGIKGSTAGTSLRQVMVSLTGPTTAATGELKKLGIITADGTNAFIDSTGKLKSLSDIFQILQDHTKGLTQAQTLAATKTIFNSRALAAANILMQDGAAGFAKMDAQIGDTSAMDVAHKRLDNLSGDLAHLKNSIQTTLIVAGTPLQNFARTIVQAVTKIVQAFGNLSPGIQTAIIWISGIVGALLLFLGTGAIFIGMILKMIQIYKEFGAALKLIGSAMKVFGLAMRALSATLMTNPVFLIIAALVLLGIALYLLWTRSTTFRNIVKGVWDWMKTAAVDTKNWVVNAFQNVIDFFKKWGVLILVVLAPFIGLPLLIYMKWGAIAGFFVGIWNSITSGVSTAFNSVIGFFTGIWDAIVGFFSRIIAFVSYHINLFLAIFLGPYGLIIDAIKTHWDWIYDKITTVWNAVEGFIMTVWNAIYGFISGQLKLFVAFWSGIWDAVSTALVTAWNAIAAFFTTIWNAIYAAVSAAVTAVWTVITDAWNVIWNFTVSIFNAVWGFISSIFSTIYNFVAGIVDSIYTRLSTGFQNLYNRAVGIFSAMYGAIVGQLNAVVSYISGIGQTIVSVIGGYAGAMVTAGANLIHGLWDGISGLGGWLWQQAMKYLNDFKNKVLGFFGIHSPSTMFADMGKNLMIGLANGIGDHQDKAVAAASAMAAAVTDASQIQLGMTSGSALSGMAQQLAGQQLAQLGLAGTSASTSAVTNNSGTSIDNLTINNPVQEQATTTLPRMLRAVNYLSTGPR